MPDPIKLGLDYSARRLPGASIAAAGYSFVFRYLDFPGQRYPALNREEHDDLVRNGIEVHAIFEINVHDPAGGRDAGKRNAATAVQSARAAGLPVGSAIFMCSDAPYSQWNYSMDTAMAYLDAARLVIEDSEYVIGAYGFKEFIYAAQDGGHADVFWLCGAESGVREGVHAYQWNNGRVYVDGLDCDLNKMFIPIGANDDMSWNEIGKVLPDGQQIEYGRLVSLIDDAASAARDAARESAEKVVEVLALVQGINADVNELKRKVDAIATGGVSEEKIAEIAVDAVRDDLSD